MTSHLARLGAMVAALALAAPAAVAQRDEPADIVELRQLLVRHRWTALDSALDARAAEARADIRREGRYVFAFDAFVSGDSALQIHLDAWIDAEPGQARPRAARAAYFRAMASAAVLHGPTARYADQASREIRYWDALARGDAEAGAEHDSTEVMAYAASLDDCRSNETALAAIRRLWPGTVLLRARYMATASPSCGVTLQRMSRFAANQQGAARWNPRLRVLGHLPLFYETIYAADTLGSRRTLAVYSSILSHDDFWEVRYQRAGEYLKIQQYEAALVDLDHVIAERPGYAPALAWRAAALQGLAKRESGQVRADLRARSWRDAMTAASLNAKDPDVAPLLSQGPARDGASSANRTP
jgi:hypothetical protein